MMRTDSNLQMQIGLRSLKLIDLSLRMRIDSSLLKLIGWHSMMRTDSNLQMQIDLRSLKRIDSNLQMRIDSSLLKQTDLRSLKLIG